MIISVVIVAYESGGVLFSRFYGHELHTELQQGEWLKKLRDSTISNWPLLKEDYPEQVATIGEVQVVCKLIGDVVLMLAGVEEYDVLLLTELAHSMAHLIRKLCTIPETKAGETRVSAERRILQHYANLCLIVDEQIDDGDIDHLNPKVVAKLIRMRPAR